MVSGSVGTVSCVTARVDGHIRSNWEGKAGSTKSSDPWNFLAHYHEERVTARLIWDVCYSEAALAARFMLKFSHLVQFHVILPRHLQSLREDWNFALTWQRTWPCTEGRDPQPRAVRSGLFGAARAAGAARVAACRRPNPCVLSGCTVFFSAVKNELPALQDPTATQTAVPHVVYAPSIGAKMVKAALRKTKVTSAVLEGQALPWQPPLGLLHPGSPSCPRTQPRGAPEACPAPSPGASASASRHHSALLPSPL